MIGERFNFEDVFFRDLTVCVLDTLEGEIKWVNRFTSGDRVVNVPFYYSMTGDERFLLDSFTDDVVSNSRYVDLNTDIIPRGHLTLTSYEIRSDEFANPNVWLKMVIENDDEIKKYLTKLRAIPISAKYDLTILLSSEIDTFKCSQAIMDTLWLYRFMYFEHNFMNIDAVMMIPDSSNIEINREKTLTSDNTIKMTVSFEVQTYYPAYRKPKLAKSLPYEISTDYPSRSCIFYISIFEPNSTNVIYSEQQTATTSADGGVVLPIGYGSVTSGDLATIINKYVTNPAVSDSSDPTVPTNQNVTLIGSITSGSNIITVVDTSGLGEPSPFNRWVIQGPSNVINVLGTVISTTQVEIIVSAQDTVSSVPFEFIKQFSNVPTINISLDPNPTNEGGSSGSVPIVILEPLDLSIIENNFNPNNAWSNSSAFAGPDGVVSDLILYPKMTRWYKNLVAIKGNAPGKNRNVYTDPGVPIAAERSQENLYFQRKIN
jgi:hypothetical protein